MTVESTRIGHDAVADFALLLSEAAGVLAAIAQATPSERSAELEELQAIIAEGAASACGIPEAATSAEAVVALPEILRVMLADVMNLGKALAPGRSPAGPQQINAIEAMTRALSSALDGLDDPARVTAKARVVNTCADILGAAPTHRRPSDPVESLVVATLRAAGAVHGLAADVGMASTARQTAV